jgi:hypothetical protein
MARKLSRAGMICTGVVLSVALVFGGCTNMPSYEALFDPSPEAEGTGIAVVGLVRAVVIIARYQATERQRAVANQRARAAYAKLVRSAGETSTRTMPREPSTGGKKTAKRKPVRKKVPRYIAVDTERDTRSKGAKSIMIWDTQVQQVVGNEVFDVQAPPRPLDTAKFDTYSAQYVGAGL